jgi:transposase InsO family protein
LTLEGIYKRIGISRQGVFQRIEREKKEYALVEDLRVKVRNYRHKKDRQAGSRSIYYNLNIKELYGMGVTKFEQLMSKYGLVQVRVRLKVVTTRSDFRSWVYKNEIKGLVINEINKVIAGDLTYVYYGRYLYYLFCLTDLYSMRIVGYHVGERMRSIEAIKALKMAIRTRKGRGFKECIHHTDGGSQYFSKAYLTISINSYKKISVAKTCLENGYAEQKNNILKHHLIPTIEADNYQVFKNELDKSIAFYNNERKQENLGWKSPIEFEKALEEENIKKEIKLK